jgi:hypothetical protein
MSISGDPQKGHDSDILVGLQNAQRTTVTPDRRFGFIEEETDHPDPEVEWNEQYLIGTGREQHGKDEGQRTYEGGSYPIIPYDGFPIYLLFGAYQSFTADSPSTGTDTHTFEVLGGDGGSATESPPTFTVEGIHYGRGGASDFVRTFNTVGVSSGEISVDNEGRLTTTLDTLALGVSPGSSPTAISSVPDRNPWLFSDISSNFSFDGTTFARFEEFTYSLNQNASAKHYVESDRAPDPYEILWGGQANHELTATITVVDDTLYSELTSATDGGVNVNFRFTRPNGDYMDFDLQATNLTEVPHTTPRGESGDDDAVQVEATIVPESVVVEVTDSNSAGARYDA